MEIGPIEKDIPFTPDETKRQIYSFFDHMEIGESFKVFGTEPELKRMRSVIRSRNLRYKKQFGDMSPKFDWVYILNGIRIWRIR